jgi:putative ABC transport system permease protein
VLVRGVLAVLSPLVGAFGVAGWLAAAVARTQARRFAAIAVPLALMFAINATMLLNSTLIDEVTGRQQADRIAAASTRVSAPTGLPLAVAEQVVAVPGVTGAAVTFPTRVIVVTGGKPEDYPAQGLLTAGPESALDLALTSGSLSALASPPASAASDGDTADQAARPVSEPAVLASTPAADPKPTAADPKPMGGFAASGSLTDAQQWRIGDAVKLWLADGYPVTLRLEAIYQRSRGFGDLVLPAGLIARHDPRGLAGAVLLRGDGVAEQVRAGWPQLTVVDALAPAAAGDAQNQQGAWELMVVITLGFTAIAVVNTFAIATSARRREYGDLRLIGATTGQIWRTAGREGLLAVSAGLLLGCAVTAVVVGAFSVAQDGRFRLIVDAGVYLAMLGGVGSLGLLAGALPVRLMLRRRSLPAPAGDE